MLIRVWHLPFYISEISFNPICAHRKVLKAYLHVLSCSSNVENGSIKFQIFHHLLLFARKKKLYHMIGLTTKLETNNHAKIFQFCKTIKLIQMNQVNNGV